MSEITNNPAVPTQIVGSVKFPRFINNLGIIPTSYKDSMSYYECLAWLCKFLEETVIPTVNQNGQAVEELQALYVELNSYVTNYFDNLDVQEEINNKLDDMVEQGTLQEIIASYLNSKAVFGYDTVSDLQEATNLIEGSFVKTLGYYSKNDNGGAIYKIVEDTPNSFYITLDSGLYAEYIPEGVINLVQLGLKENDNTFDNSTIFDNIIKPYYQDYKLVVPIGNYYFQDRINLDKIHLEMNEDTQFILNSTNTIDCFFKIRGTDEIGHYLGNYIKGGIINCNDKANVGIGINNSRFFEISTKVYNFNSIGLDTCFQAKTTTMLACAGSFIHNCLFYNENEKLNTIAIYDKGNDNQFDNIIVQDVVTGINLGPGSSVHSLHHWLSRRPLYDTSTSIIIRAGNNILQDIIADTIATAIQYTTNYTRATVSGLLYYFSTHVIDNTYLSTHIPTVFKLATLNSLYITNSIFSFSNGTFKLFDDDSFSSYRASGVNTTQFVNIENSLYQQPANVTNILVSPLNMNQQFNSLLGYVNNPEITRSTDLDTITKTGIYGFNTYSGSGGNNTPLPARNTIGVMLVIGGKSNIMQILIAYHYARIVVRSKYGDTWDNWHDYTGTYEETT